MSGRPRGWALPVFAVLATLVGIAFWAAVIYVSWHFLGKYW